MNEYIAPVTQEQLGEIPPRDEDRSTSLTEEERDALLAPIDEKEREILRLRFGLDRGEPRTFEEVGNLLDIDPDEVRTREISAMNKLRSANLS